MGTRRPGEDGVPGCPTTLGQLSPAGDTSVLRASLCCPSQGGRYWCRDSRLGAGVVGDLLDDLAVYLVPQDLVLCAQLEDRYGSLCGWGCPQLPPSFPGHPQDSPLRRGIYLEDGADGIQLRLPPQRVVTHELHHGWG